MATSTGTKSIIYLGLISLAHCCIHQYGRVVVPVYPRKEWDRYGPDAPKFYITFPPRKTSSSTLMTSPTTKSTSTTASTLSTTSTSTTTTTTTTITTTTTTVEVPGNNTRKIVVVIGGRNYSYVHDSVEVFDVESEMRCQDLPPYPLAHDGAIAEFYMGKIIVCGGSLRVNNAITTKLCYQYNVNDRNWTEFGQLNEAKLVMGSSIINRVWLVTGGMLNNAQYVYRTTEYFDKDEGSFKFGPHMPIQMRIHCQITINSTHVFLSDVFGTRSTYLLDWNTYEFKPMPPILVAYYNPTCGLCWSQERGKEVVVVGKNEARGNQLASHIFSLTSLDWREGPELSMELNSIAGMQSAQIETSFVITGGVWSGQYIDTMLKYVPEQETFVTLNVTMKTGRAYHTALSVSGDIVDCT